MQAAGDSAHHQIDSSQSDHESLLRAVATDLKLPLMYIARQAELSRSQEAVSLESLRAMQTYADAALGLVDSYMLGLDLRQQEFDLELEPVSLSSVLYDAAHAIEPLVRQRGGDLELVLAGRYGQVMAHRGGLYAAVQCLGSVLAETADGTSPARTVTLAAHRSPHGIVTGLYSPAISQAFPLQQARRTKGAAMQPFTGQLFSGGAGIFVADMIFASMHTTLRNGRFRGQQGLAVTLPLSQQMRLV